MHWNSTLKLHWPYYCPLKLLRKGKSICSWFFCPSKLRRRKYIEITSIFRPRYYVERYVEATWIFHSSKWPQKFTSKQRGYLSIFVFSLYRRYIDIDTCCVRWSFFQYFSFNFRATKDIGAYHIETNLLTCFVSI